MKNTQYINIQGWMINELKLKGNDLIVYAIIYGFSQDGESEFKGSINYLCEAINSTRPTVRKALKNLCEKQFILKETIDNNFNVYRANIKGVKKLYPSSKETLPFGGKETLPNNTNINTIGNNGEIPLKIEPIKKSNKKFVPPTENEVIKYFEEKGYSKESAKKAFIYYDVAEWKDSTGKKVKNWKQKMISVWFKPENKISTDGNSFNINDYNA